MKIAVINGTEKHGVTYRLKELFLEELRDAAEITEFYLPKDCPSFCTGCTNCISKSESLCRDAAFVQKIDRAMRDADLLVFTSPTYVFHVTGAMKSLLDHFAYHWMPHRPAGELFGKRALIITQTLGAGEASAAKDIRDSLSWWGVPYIRTVALKLLGHVVWDKLPEKRRRALTAGVQKAARHFRAIDYTKPARTTLAVKAKFYAVRMLQARLGKANPEYTDYVYWKTNGWLDRARPWKRGCKIRNVPETAADRK